MNSGRLHVHRIILAARIPSLRTALSGSLRQENSVLRWPTVPLRIASAFIHYVYTGRVEITQANVRDMIALARMMNLSDIENWGVNFMASRVTFENLATTWDYASSMNIGSLRETCIHLMRMQFQSSVRSDLFVCLPADTMLALLRDDSLPVDSEEEVLAAISSWVGPGSEERNERLKMHAPTMLKEVRWLQTTVQFRDRLMASHPMFRKSVRCASFLSQVEQWMKSDDKDKPPCPFNRDRRLVPKLFVFGKEKNRNRWSVHLFDSDLRKEERIADMEYRYDASYTLVGEGIFVIGGFSGESGDTTRVQEFLLRERRWCERAPLTVGRHSHAATVVRVEPTPAESGEKTLIGVFGGSEPLSCAVYDIKRDRWCTLPNLREERLLPAAACLPGDNRIFVFGGVPCLNSVEFCQLGTNWQERANTTSTANFWMPAAPMRTARFGLAATPFRGRILVAGGCAGFQYLNVVEVFSPPDAWCPRGQWTELATMKQPRGHFTLFTSAGGAVFALGGSDIATKNTVETLTAPDGSPDSGNDPKSWVWSLKNPLETFSDIWGAASIRM